MLPINTDSDGDGLLNTAEWFEHGTDSANPDSDGDGIDDGAEIAAGTSPVNAGTFPGDGDINEDSTTNLGDLVLLYRMVMGTLTPTPAQLARADMNQDGQLNAADILLLQQQLLQSWLGVGAPSSGAIAQRGPTWLQASASPLLDWLITPTHAVPANSGVLYYVHNDPLGTPQALTDETGAVVWTAIYDPFGKATTNEDPDGDGNSVTLNVRFPGQYYDSETGLHYNTFRTYDPTTGRYLEADPIGQRGGINIFLYAENNPIRNIDPLGLCPGCVVGGPATGVGGFGGLGGFNGSGGIDTTAPFWPKPIRDLFGQQNSAGDDGSRPPWWPDDVPHPSDGPRDTTTECPVDPQPDIPDTKDLPPNNSCGALARYVQRRCIEAGGTLCTSKAIAFYFSCLLTTGGGGGLGGGGLGGLPSP